MLLVLKYLLQGSRATAHQKPRSVEALGPTFFLTAGQTLILSSCTSAGQMCHSHALHDIQSQTSNHNSWPKRHIFMSYSHLSTFHTHNPFAQRSYSNNDIGELEFLILGSRYRRFVTRYDERGEGDMATIKSQERSKSQAKGRKIAKENNFLVQRNNHLSRTLMNTETSKSKREQF